MQILAHISPVLFERVHLKPTATAKSQKGQRQFFCNFHLNISLNSVKIGAKSRAPNSLDEDHRGGFQKLLVVSKVAPTLWQNCQIIGDKIIHVILAGGEK